MSHFKIPTDLDGGLYFFGNRRTTIDSEKFFNVYEQRIGKILTKCPISDKITVDEIVSYSNEAQKSWGSMTPLERGHILRKAANIIRDHHKEIVDWEVKTNGKPKREAIFDIYQSADTLDFYAGIAPQALLGNFFPLLNNKHAYTTREPFGVVGAIGAWNYPFQTAMWKIAPALAAGNSVVYKPSPFSPASPVLIGEILAAAGLPPNVYCVIQGEGETGQALVENKLIKKVSFTGSVTTGQKIQEACARKSIKPCTLELGGKSALIICEDASIDNAISCSILANFFNQGQVCTNATRVFVHKNMIHDFTKSLLIELDKIFVVGDPMDEKTNVGATINEEHLNKVISFVESAKKEGATILRGGYRVKPKGVENGFYFEPCVIGNVTNEMKVAREEIFGAVMLLIPYETEEEAINHANNTDFGLAAGVITNDLAKAHKIAQKLEAGTVFINTYNDCEIHVPFGGMKNSGIGRENSLSALLSYTQEKTVYINLSSKIDHGF
ncbi:Aldehyde dehydrogenase family 1 member A3 [Strongyloides ratti]|uniref:Aldehyde dehydrogenase family 1 member A3 n=1 Tax=Strongyloides ratti TaxID=34506 RepID=A0A090LLF3_STRRB|nr:Aldehyde dehydrogenase family 1 member A3 [Strongyloides ratti]CEF68370.1 Aldehyde dehydrogenase family 1 member A3 [Strongyloides ratti]